MMNQYNYSSGILLVLLLLVLVHACSCKKYLEEKPDSSIAVPTTLSDLQALLDNTNIMNMQRTPNYGEASSDDYFLLSSDYHSFDEEKRNIYLWKRGVYSFQNDWSIAYEPVYVSNFCLEGLNPITVTSSNNVAYNNVKGSALFYRSYYYLNLLWVFAKSYDESTAATDFGIILRETSDFNVPSTRASVKECYDRIIKDVSNAALLLPDIAKNVLRPSKAAAYGLLAKTYLSMRKYDSAYKYADLCLQINSNLIDYNGDTDINGDLTNDYPFKRFNKETIFYSDMNTTFFVNNPYYAKVDTLLYASYLPNDLRKIAFFAPVGDYFQFKGNYTEELNYFTGIATDEMFFIRAECHARAGRIAEAMNDLNTVIIKRWDNTVPYPTFTATSTPEAVNIILTERRKELQGRGLRWMDIKRLNKENAGIVPIRKIDGVIYPFPPNTDKYALPLPADIIDLTGVPQN